MSLITCENISFSYENQAVVSDLNFKIKHGEYLCIVGENGSGKTTLIKGLLGLKKPSSGVISMGEGLKHTQIGYLPQQTKVQKDFPASVYEVVLSGCLNNRGLKPGFGNKEKALVSEKMELLGISQLKKRSYKELSGGQQQRVLLARALCATHKLILLDEPSTGLDPMAANEFYHLIDRLNKEHGITVIMVSHAIKEAVQYASHILHLSDKGYFYGKTEEYVESEYSHQFLGGKQV